MGFVCYVTKPVFTEELYAERYIEKFGHTDYAPKVVPEKDTVRVFEKMQAAGFVGVGVDSKGEQDSSRNVLPIKKAIELARQNAK